MRQFIDEIKKELRDIKEHQNNIRESQIRMESDIKHHIKRTDLLEKKLDTEIAEVNQGVEKLRGSAIRADRMMVIAKFISWALGAVATVVSIVYGISRVSASEIRNVEDIRLDIERVIGCELVVHSHKRSPEHNKRVGGSKNSYHLSGRAMDVSAPCVSLKELGDVARKYASGVIYYNDHIHFDNREKQICLIATRTKSGVLYKYC